VAWVGAIEHLSLGRDTKLLDALFVMQDPASGGLAAVDLASGRRRRHLRVDARLPP
jgi:hypothetical protein